MNGSGRGKVIGGCIVVITGYRNVVECVSNACGMRCGNGLCDVANRDCEAGKGGIICTHQLSRCGREVGVVESDRGEGAISAEFCVPFTTKLVTGNGVIGVPFTGRLFRVAAYCGHDSDRSAVLTFRRYGRCRSGIGGGLVSMGGRLW